MYKMALERAMHASNRTIVQSRDRSSNCDFHKIPFNVAEQVPCVSAAKNTEQHFHVNTM